MRRSSRATMSQHKQLTLVIMIVGIVLIAGLVVAQGDYYGNRDDLVFPGPVSRGGKPSPAPANKFGGDSELSRSLQLAKEISSFDSVDEFLSLVRGVPELTKSSFFGGRIGGEERSNAERAIPAKCIPELQPVSLNVESDPSTIYFPSCTRVKRCGGCCSHSLLSCQPVASEFRNFEVMVVSVGHTDGLSYKGKRIVPLEEHTKCSCDCRIKAEHCTEKQSYVQQECRCACNNVDEAEKCAKSNETKIWNPELCTCLCRDEQECSTGFYFDQNTCRCRQVPLSRTWFPPTQGANYKFGQTQKPESVPPVIIPLDAADPRRKPKEDPQYK